MTQKLPHVHVVSTGGTIASRPVSPTQTTGYSQIALTGDDLVAGIPGIEQQVRLSTEQIFSVASSALKDADLLRLSQRVSEVLEDPDVEGVVVTHGTDTMEETAFFLNLTVRSEKPVILTGAMRPSTVLSGDGPLNLMNAILAAADPQSRGMGVMVCMNDHLLAARDVMKTSTYKVETFRCPEGGCLGLVMGGMVHYRYAPLRPHTAHSEFDVRGLAELPQVEVVYTHIGCGTEMLRAALKSGCRGIVAAGTGNGSLPPEFCKTYREWPGEKPAMVRASRVPGGFVGDYSGKRDAENGTVPGCGFSPQKSRLLLQLALTVSSDRDYLCGVFSRY